MASSKKNKRTKYQKAPRYPSHTVIGKTLAIPLESTEVVLQVRRKTDMDYVRNELLPQFEAMGGQVEPGQVILTGKKKTPYGVIAGLHRREVCIIRQDDFIATVQDIAMDDREGQLASALTSNTGRPMDLFELAERGAELVEKYGWSLEKAAILLKVSRATLAKRLKLTQLNLKLRSRVESGEIPLDAASEVAHFPKSRQAEVIRQVTRVGDSDQMAAAIQTRRYQEGYGPQRKVNPNKKRATIEYALEQAVRHMDRAADFSVDELREYFTSAERGDIYRVSRELGNIVAAARNFDEKFAQALDLEHQFNHVTAKSSRSQEEDPTEELKALLGKAVRLGNMTNQDFTAMFRGRDPNTVHAFFANLAEQAAKSLELLRKRILESAKHSKF